MESAGVSTDTANLAAFVSETGVETAFGLADQKTQYQHPDMYHYVGGKPQALTRAINRSC